MKRWLRLFAILAVAAVVALFLRTRPSDDPELGVRLVQVGMTEEEVVAIMGPGVNDPGYIEWRHLKEDLFACGGVITTVRVYFDAHGRVTKKTVNGNEQ